MPESQNPSRKLPLESDSRAAMDEQPDSRAVFGELRRVDMLSLLSDEELGLLATRIEARQFGKGEVLMRQGDESDRFYILRKGRVEMYAQGEDGAPPMHILDLADSSQKNFFGEVALLTGGKCKATVRAITEVDVWEIGREAFAKLFRVMPGAAASISEVLVRRSIETS
jgi:CRP-like cAMP-binding protein